MGRTRGSNRWRDALVLALVFAAVYVAIFDPKIDLNGDNAAYLALGESLASGQGYHDLVKPGQPPANHLPPGYPLLLAALMSVSSNLLFLKAVNGALLLGAALLVQALGRGLGLSPPLVLVASLVTILNAHLLRSATIVMSEATFLALTMLALVASIRARDSSKPAWRDPWTWTAAVALAAAMTVRTAGVAVVAAVVVWFLRSRRWGTATILIGTVAAAALPWFVRSQSLDGNSYVHQLLMVNPYDLDSGTATPLELVRRAGENAARYAGGEIAVALYATLRTSVGGIAVSLASLAVVAFAVLGLRRIPRHASLVGLVLAATFSLLLFWPSQWSGARFLHGIVPLLILASLAGLESVVTRFAGRAVPAPVWYALPLVFLPPLKFMHEVARMDYPPAYAAFFRAADWMRENTPVDTVVCTRKPDLFHWRSRRPCDVFPYTADTERVIAAMESMNASYVVVDRLGLPATPRFLAPAIARHSARFETVPAATDEQVLVVRFLRSVENPSP